MYLILLLFKEKSRESCCKRDGWTDDASQLNRDILFSLVFFFFSPIEAISGGTRRCICKLDHVLCFVAVCGTLFVMCLFFSFLFLYYVFVNTQRRIS